MKLDGIATFDVVQHGAPRSLDELEEHRGIFYANRGAVDWRFAAAGQTRIVHGQPGMVLNNGDMMRDAAIAGLGIALRPAFIVSGALAAGPWWASTSASPPNRNSSTWRMPTASILRPSCARWRTG